MILYWNSWELIWTSSLRCKTKRNLSSNISTFEFLQWLIYPLEKSDGRKLQVSISGEANPDWRQANSDQNQYIWPIPDAKGPAIVKVYWFQLRDLGHRVDFSIHKPKREKKRKKKNERSLSNGKGEIAEQLDRLKNYGIPNFVLWFLKIYLRFYLDAIFLQQTESFRNSNNIQVRWSSSILVLKKNLQVVIQRISFDH